MPTVRSKVGAVHYAITGATSGIGQALARQLLAEGKEVISISRSDSDDPDLRRAAALGTFRNYRADLSDFGALSRVIDEIAVREPRIDVLVNNAGVNPSSLMRSPQGRELTFEMNVVVPFVVSYALEPLLQKGRIKKIINISSDTALRVKSFEPDKLANPAQFQKLFGAYAQSKLALSLWTAGLGAEFAARGITLLSVHPGPTATPMTRGDGMPLVLRLLARLGLVFGRPEDSAARVRNAIDDPDLKSGAFVLRPGDIRILPHLDKSTALLKILNKIAEEEVVQTER